jgi:hypothetical protein
MYRKFLSFLLMLGIICALFSGVSFAQVEIPSSTAFLPFISERLPGFIDIPGALFSEKVHFFAFNKAMPKDPKPLQQRGVVAMERIGSAVQNILGIKTKTLVEAVMSEEDYLSGKAEIKVSQAILWEELDRYAKTISDQDTIVIYSHSHGVKNNFVPGEPWGGLRLDAPPRDGKPLPHRGVTPWPEYMEKILKLPAKTVVVMVMSCYSGGLIDYLHTIEDQWIHRAEEGRNFIVLTSQNALLMSGPVKIGNEMINPFTYAVEQAFLGKADGFITGEADGKIDINEWTQYILHTTMLHDKNAHPMAIGAYQQDLNLFDI